MKRLVVADLKSSHTSARSFFSHRIQNIELQGCKFLGTFHYADCQFRTCADDINSENGEQPINKPGRRYVTEHQSKWYIFFPRHRRSQISRLISIHSELLVSCKSKERLTLWRRLWEVHDRDTAQSNWTVWDQVLTYMRCSCRQTKSHFAHIRTNRKQPAQACIFQHMGFPVIALCIGAVTKACLVIRECMGSKWECCRNFLEKVILIC